MKAIMAKSEKKPDWKTEQYQLMKTIPLSILHLMN